MLDWAVEASEAGRDDLIETVSRAYRDSGRPVQGVRAILELERALALISRRDVDGAEALIEKALELVETSRAALESNVPMVERERAWHVGVIGESEYRLAQVRLKVALAAGLRGAMRKRLAEFQRVAAPHTTPGQGVFKAPKFVQRVCLEIDVSLAMAEYRTARERAREALATREFVSYLEQEQQGEKGRLAQETYRLEIERRLAIAATQLAIVEPESLPEARTLLAGIDPPLDIDRGAALDIAFRRFTAAMLANDADGAGAALEVVDAPFDLRLGKALRLAMAAELGEDAGVGDAVRRLLAERAEAPPLDTGTGHFFDDQTRYVVRVATEVAERAKGAGAALDLVLDAFALHDLARVMGATPLNGAQLQSLLGADEVALVLWGGDRRGLVFAVTRDDVHMERIEGAERMRGPVRTLRSRLSPAAAANPRGAEAWRTAAAAVTGELIPDSIAKLLDGASRLMVIGDDHYFDLPVNSLRVGDRPIGESMELGVIPTAGFLGLVRGRPDSEDEARAMVIANVPTQDWIDAEGLTLDDITLSGDWLREFTGYLDTTTTELLTGEDGAEDRLLARAAPLADVLAVWCHGTVTESAVQPSALLLGSSASGTGDGKLSCAEAAILGGARIVLLFTCGGGAGPTNQGSAIINHLGGAFLRGGASAVLLAGEDLAAGPTARIAMVMARALGEGATIGEALRRAREELRDEPGFEHPSSLYNLRIVGDPGARLARPVVRMGGRSTGRRPGELPKAVLIAAPLAVALTVGLLLFVARRRGRRAS